MTSQTTPDAEDNAVRWLKEIEARGFTRGARFILEIAQEAADVLSKTEDQNARIVGYIAALHGLAEAGEAMLAK